MGCMLDGLCSWEEPGGAVGLSVCQAVWPQLLEQGRSSWCSALGHWSCPADCAAAACPPGLQGGVLRRPGHTEASVDLCRLAGCAPAGVLCEIVSAGGHFVLPWRLLRPCCSSGLL